MRKRKKDVLVRERRQGSFRRSVSLPSDADEGAISAELRNGVLTLAIPKSEEARQAEKKIDIKTG